jgi:urease accessory protein
MNAIHKLLEQRSVGHVKLHMGQAGPRVLREAGAAKVRLPRGSAQAILINVGGGLAGGDAFEFDIACEDNAALTITTQSAERVYRSLGPPAVVLSKIEVAENAQLFWLPNETILFDGACLQRRYEVSLSASAKFLAVEPIVLGRTAMNEVMNTIHLKDSWRIHREGTLIHAEELKLGPDFPTSKATLGGAHAMATVIYIAEDAEQQLENVCAVLDKNSAASAWNGKLIARSTAADGFILRKILIPVMNVLAGKESLPKNWTD